MKEIRVLKYSWSYFCMRIYHADIRELGRGMDETAIRRLSQDPDRVMKYHLNEDRVRCVVGELMIRKITGENPIRFDGIQNIKPVCRNSCFFNLSHDSDLVVLGTSESWSVGIDVMKIKPSNPNVPITQMLSNLRNIFDIPEWEYIQSGSDEHEKLTKFFELWTAKEAYVKCIGTGLYTEPQDISLDGFQSGSDLTVKHRGKTAEHSAQFKIKVMQNIFPGYIVSVCLGPIGNCDPSWVQFVENRASLPVTAVDIEEIVPFHLENMNDA